MGGPEDFGVRIGGLIRLLDLPLPRSRKLLGAVAATNLGQKPKLGGVRSLLTFPLYYPFLFLFVLIFSKFLPVLICSFFAKTTKIFISSFPFAKSLKNPKRFLF